jgi:hypothetical protein
VDGPDSRSIAATACSIASADENLRAGSFSRALITTASNDAGTSGRRERSGGTVSFRWCIAIEIGESPPNGGSPAKQQ